MNTAEEGSVNRPKKSPSKHKSSKNGGNVGKVSTAKCDDLNKSDNKLNGVNGCSVSGHSTHDETADILDRGQQSDESTDGIRLLCDAVDAIETSKCEKRCQHLNGLVDNHCINGQTNSLSAITSGSLPSTSSCCCCQTSPSSSSSATTSCSTSSATLSCDTNKEESVQFIDDDKDIDILTNGVSYRLNISELNDKINFVNYESERQMPDIMRLIQKDLSEPYSIYTYRYFIHNWPHLCFLAMDGDKCVGAIVCKLDLHKMLRRGYIAMLAVDENYRKKKIGSNLVLKAIEAMIAGDADEVVLETEVTNKPALMLYENLGFVRDKRLFRYYLNGVDALRLKLWLK